jgi:hypothetical protein
VYRTGKEITAAAQASAAELQPLIDRAESDGLIQQASTPDRVGLLTTLQQLCSWHLEYILFTESINLACANLEVNEVSRLSRWPFVPVATVSPT